MKFKDLNKLPINEAEKEIGKYWEENNIFERTITEKEGNEKFVFYDGPATANGMPGLHHMLAKFLKDSITRYKTMRGFQVYRKVGWDTHGLPVELEVEKSLGLNNKTDIEKYGLAEFNNKCRESVWKNEVAFSRATKKLGQFIDTKNPYVTYNNDYIETEWWILKKFFDEGLIYQGHKIIPYCSRCGTGLASHEVAQGYKEVSVNSVIVPMKLKDEDTHMLVWTTTPWTLLSNVALAVNPKEEYIKASSMGYNFIVSKKLAPSVLGEEYKIIEEYKGKDLEYREYEQLLPFIKIDKKAFFVTCADYVSMEDGTGIVHIAPAFGEEDYNVGRAYDLPVVNPVGEDGKFLEGPFEGKFVIDTDLDVIKYLKENDKLFKKIKLEHNYPFCWRCDTPLLYYSKPSWYIKTTAFKDKIIEQNKTVNWIPGYVGEKRFANWLENLNDWALSRTRYWGTPLPLWTCECGHMHMVGSREELKDMALTEVKDDIDLHRPHVDNIQIKCEKCGKPMNRVEEVIDCWFDSGSMPFAQYHYPFENKDFFETQFPADFICEGIDQTRGWFYVLLVISTFVMGKAPYKNVLVNDLLLDANGKKMSKSKGNVLDPFDIMDEYGADTLRWYFPYGGPIWLPKVISEDGLKEVYSKYVSTFKNLYTFFAMYSNADNIDPTNYDIPVKDRNTVDKWMISKLNILIKRVTEEYEAYDLTKVVKLITEFLNDDVSNWYIRSNRRRFWDSELTDDKKSVYLTTYEVLIALSKLTAPISVYLSDEIYQKLTNEDSVHLADFPTFDESLIEENLEYKMDLIRDICSLGRNAREEVKIKVRQPLKSILLNSELESDIKEFESIIKEELNIKEIKFLSNLEDYMIFSVKPNYRNVGRILGPKIKLFEKALNEFSSDKIKDLKETETTIYLDGEEFVVSPDYVEIKIEVKEGFAAASNEKVFVILDTELTADLVTEGISRELVRKIQSMRKDMDLNITDKINVYYNGDESIIETFEKSASYIKSETLTVKLLKTDEIEANQEINELNAHIKIEKA